jgi:hypothetical protein
VRKGSALYNTLHLKAARHKRFQSDRNNDSEVVSTVCAKNQYQSRDGRIGLRKSLTCSPSEFLSQSQIVDRKTNIQDLRN